MLHSEQRVRLRLYSEWMFSEEKEENTDSRVVYAPGNGADTEIRIVYAPNIRCLDTEIMVIEELSESYTQK